MTNAISSTDAAAGIVTNAADAASTTDTNAVALAKDAVSNILEKGAASVTNATVASVEASSEKTPERQSTEDGFPITIPVLIVAVIVACFAATRKKPAAGASTAGSEEASSPSPRTGGRFPTEPRSDERAGSTGSGQNIPSAEAGTIADDVLAAVAPDAPDHAALRAALLTAITGGAAPSDPRLAGILRIDESFEKRPGSKYLRRVSVLRRKGGTTGSLAKIESEIGWEYVPDAVRGEFIRTRGDKVVRRVYDAGNAERK